jgi:hypothetical protein
MILSLGQPTTLPDHLAANPFYRLIVKFSRYKTGSLEILFAIEAALLRYTWVGLFAMFALVLPNLEEITGAAPLVRLATIVYPSFFIWSITRIAGVELLQLILEGHWTYEVLTTPLDNRDLKHGFITPVWIIVRRYGLISFFSLALYCLETSVFVLDENGRLILNDFIARVWFTEVFFFGAVAWIVFVYLARLFGEARLRNGLLKGLSTVALIVGYCLLLIRYPHAIADGRVLWGLTALSALLLAASVGLHRLLSRSFRRYLHGQLGIDLLIFDNVDLHATAWNEK